MDIVARVAANDARAITLWTGYVSPSTKPAS